MSFEIGGWILVALGALLAFTGRRMVWLAVGIAGFGLGWLLTQALFPAAGSMATFLAGLVLGLVGAVIALRGLPLLINAASAVLIGLLGLTIFGQLSSNSGFWQIVGFVVGAVAGVFLVRASFDWGIPAITAVGGGALVWNGVLKALPSLPGWVAMIAALAVAVAGFMAQRATPAPEGELAA